MKRWMIVPVAMIAVFAVIYSHVPLQVDDYIFQAEYLKANSWNTGFSLSALLKAAQVARLTDNGRIANILAPLSSTVPLTRAVFPYLSALAVAAVMLLAARAAAPRTWRSVRILTGTWLLMLGLLPWHDCILVADYTLNYVWSAALTLGFISWIIYRTPRGWKTWQVVATLPAAVIAAGWHEGFALPCCAGLLLLTFTDKTYLRSQQWWTVCLVYGLAALWFALSPGLLARAAREASENLSSGTLRTAVNLGPFVLTCTVLGLCYARPRWRGILTWLWQQPMLRVTAGMGVAAMCLSVPFTPSPRVYFLCNLCCIIILMALLSRFRWPRYSGAILLVLCVAQGSYCAGWQIRYSHQEDKLLRAIHASETGTVFANTIQPWQLPKATLLMPPRTEWHTRFHLFCIRQALRKPFVAVIPTELRYASTADSTLIPGTAHLHRIGNSLYLSAHGILDTETASLNVTLRNGTQGTLSATLLPFVSHTGDTLMYLSRRRDNQLALPAPAIATAHP